MPLANTALQNHAFLEAMAQDAYFPPHLVEKGRQILVRLCEAIEAQAPADLPALYALTHAATEEFNTLAGEFEAQGSQIETAARDCIGSDVEVIAHAYGFKEADTEELIAPRDW